VATLTGSGGSDPAVAGSGTLTAPTAVVTGTGAVVITGDGQLLAPPAAAATDMGRYVWPPTAGSISVREVATADVSVR